MKSLATVFLTFFLTTFSFAQEWTSLDPISDLLLEIGTELKGNNVPAVGIALVAGDSILYAGSLGMKKRGDTLKQENRADENTLFRIGSISKMFVSLSILKLQEEGKISLKDTVKKLVPEIEFTNPWAETNPILVEHLLEHTTGWDDLHITEYAHNDPTPATLKEGLDFYPKSRTSRWVPGSRSSYCNSGPPVAAYIVEKLTGMRFEDYVQKNFFDPIGMSTATYFKDNSYDDRGVTLYNGNEAQDYWHIIMRPSGAINASPMDMATMVKFFVNHGASDSVTVISEASLNRMETPMTNVGALAGIKTGYALSNYTSYQNELLFHGHNGGVNGGLANLSYNRELGVGYAIMINSGSGTALNKISKLAAEFLTKDVPPTRKEVKQQTSSNFDGVYYSVTPRQQLTYLVDRLFSIKKVTSDENGIYYGDFPSGKPSNYRAISPNLAVGKMGIPSLAMTEDPVSGKVLASGTTVYAPTSEFRVYSIWVFTGLWLATLAIAGLWSFITVIRKLAGEVKNREHFTIQAGDFTIAISLLCLIIFAILASKDPFESLGEPTLSSVMIYLSTLVFAAASVFTFITGILKFSKTEKNATYWFFWVVSSFNLIVACYLWYFDVIGLKTWA